jgi:hypothetical protein
MRCAGLLARIQEAGVEVDRSGAGLAVEVYPGASADAFDAVIAALAARNAALGAYSLPPAELTGRAGREGWIALPTGGIDDLV